MSERNGERPLPGFEPGSLVRVTGYSAGQAARGRLCALGLTPGAVLLVESPGPGPCRLKVRGTDLLIGHSLAEKVLAVPEPS